MGAKPKIYWRERGGGARRAYADLRDYADVGGGREALVPSGEKLATTDATTAQVLLARRLEQLDAARRGRTLHGETRHATLADFASAHLVAKAESQKFTEHWLEVTEKCLDRAVEVFGAETPCSETGAGIGAPPVESCNSGANDGIAAFHPKGSGRSPGPAGAPVDPFPLAPMFYLPAGADDLLAHLHADQQNRALQNGEPTVR